MAWKLPRFVYSGRFVLWCSALAMIAAGVLVVSFFAGCGLFVPTESQTAHEQKQRETIAAKATEHVTRQESVEPAPIRVTVKGRDGSETTMETPPKSEAKTEAKTDSAEDADTRSTGVFSQSQTIPMFVKLIGVGIGLLILAVAVYVWRKLSAAFNAAWETGDKFAAHGIHRIRSLAATTTDPAQAANLVSLAADLERERSERLK